MKYIFPMKVRYVSGRDGSQGNECENTDQSVNDATIVANVLMISPSNDQHCGTHKINSNNNIELQCTCLEKGQEDMVQPTTMMELITSNPDIYWFSCITGFIRPNRSQTQRTHDFSSRTLGFLDIWAAYLHIAVVLYICVAGFYGLVQIFLPHQTYSYGPVVGLEMVTSAVPFVTMYPGVMRFRKQFYRKMLIPKAVYSEAMEYSIKSGYRLYWLLIAISVASFLTTSAYLAQQSSSLSKVGVLGSVLFGVVTIIPANLMLIGLYTLLLVEQRITFYEILQTQRLMIEFELTDKDFLETGKRIEERDKQSPIDWLLITAFVETLLCIIVLVILGIYAHEMSVDVLLVNILFIFSSFSKEVIIFISMLYQVMKVNELADIMIGQLARTLHTEDSHQKMQRMELYIAMKEYRMGSTIMYYRPSRGQLLLQIVSIVIALLTTVMRAFLSW
jgi:hypothetical protein